jgi:hypothetical protein
MKLEEVSEILKIKDTVTRYRISVGQFRHAIVESSETTIEQMFFCRTYMSSQLSCRGYNGRQGFTSDATAVQVHRIQTRPTTWDVPLLA